LKGSAAGAAGAAAGASAGALAEHFCIAGIHYIAPAAKHRCGGPRLSKVWVILG
jgi:hypothetical protein